LKKAKEQLTIKVKERKIDLEAANQKLKKEIDDRIKSEAERIELEKKLHRPKKMEAIGLLAGGIAHDLNNILSVL
jgi:C4-dicarboxylate-specific signal transduction histidine kinase